MGAHTGAALKELQPMGKTLVEEVLEGLYPEEGHHNGAGEGHEEEGSADLKHYEFTTTPFPIPLSNLRRVGGSEVQE